MTDKNDTFQELSFFDIIEETEPTKKFRVVEAEFRQIHTMVSRSMKKLTPFLV